MYLYRVIHVYTFPRDALATSTINCLTSFLSGFVIFSVLGYMSKRTGKHIEDVATEGNISPMRVGSIIFSVVE